MCRQPLPIKKTFILGCIMLMSMIGCESSDRDKLQFFLKGNSQLRAGEYQEAIRYYSESLKIDPQFAEGYNNTGIAYYELGQYTQAVDNYNKAILYKPDFTDAYFNRSNSFYLLRNYKRALDDLAIVQKDYPDSAYVYFSLGLVHTKLKIYKD